MRAFVAAMIDDAIKKSRVGNCGCHEVTIRFHFLTGQSIITLDKFISDVFENPDIVKDQFSGESTTWPPKTHWGPGTENSSIAWTKPDARTLEVKVTNTTNQVDGTLKTYPVPLGGLPPL